MATLVQRLRLVIVMFVGLFGATLVFAAPPPWIVDPSTNPNPRPGASIAGNDVITISNPLHGPCGMVRYVYPGTFTWDQLGDLTFTLDVTNAGGGQGIYANLYMDIGQNGTYGWHNGRLDYTYPITPGSTTYSTAVLTSNSLGIPSVLGGLTLAQAEAAYPNAQVSVFLNFGDTGRAGCGLVARFVDSSLGQVGGSNPSASSGAFEFGDGRIDRFNTAVPVVVYPYHDGQGGRGLKVYKMVDSEGFIELVITPEEIAAVGPAPEVPTLIDRKGDIVVYRFPHGEFQVISPNAEGKTYTLTFFHIPISPNHTPHSSTVR